MEPIKFTEYFQKILNDAVSLSNEMDSSGLLLFFNASVDWKRLGKLLGEVNFVVAAPKEIFQEAEEAGVKAVLINLPENAPVHERMSHALLGVASKDYFASGSYIVAVYSGFDPSRLDSISVIKMGDHLEQLSSKVLGKINTKVPLKTLKKVVDLALEIGREGREGKPVGTLFVVGDTRRVMENSKPAGFDPVKGYKCRERDLFDPRVCEGIKEVAQLDGAFVVSLDGVVTAACRLLDTSTAMITLSKGLGSRHWAAAAVSRTTNAVAIAVSQSSGTVRIFVNGEVILRIEPRESLPVVWHEFEYSRP